eukprot:gene3449-3945_t
MVLLKQINILICVILLSSLCITINCKNSQQDKNTIQDEKPDDFSEFDKNDEFNEPGDEDDNDFIEITTPEQEQQHHRDNEPASPTQQGQGDIEDEQDDADTTTEDEFDPFTDEEEFEGYPKKAKTTKTKIPGPDLKITKVPVHLRAGWQSFYLELITLTGLLVYAANFFTGKTKNSKLATSWFKAHKPLLESNFSIVGDDGMSKEPQSGVLVKESESVYTLWCTGRQYCEGMLVELKLLKRHDLVSVMSNMLKPKSEVVKVTVYMDDEDMESFVFAVSQKKNSTKMQRDYQDLNFFCSERKSGEKYGLPSSYTVMSETQDIAQHILSTQVCKAITMYESCFESMHFSDQYVGQKKEEVEEEGAAKPKKAKKVLIFEFKVSGSGRTKASDMVATEPLMRMVLHCIDRIKSFKLSREARAKVDKKRREAEESLLKLSHGQRQEAAMTRREEKLRAEKEKMMSEEDPDKQRRLEEKVLKSDMKKRGPKMKQMKVRM